MRRKYYNENLNIIELRDYLKDIKSYTYVEKIPVEDEEVVDVLQKDHSKDFFCSMIDRGIEPRWNENLLDQLDIYNSPYDYFVLSRVDLEKYFDIESLYEVYLELVYLLDMKEEDKYKYLYSLLYDSVNTHIIKIRRTARNIGTHPIKENVLWDLLEKIEDYKYSTFIF